MSCFWVYHWHCRISFFTYGKVLRGVVLWAGDLRRQAVAGLVVGQRTSCRPAHFSPFCFGSLLQFICHFRLHTPWLASGLYKQARTRAGGYAIAIVIFDILFYSVHFCFSSFSCYTPLLLRHFISSLSVNIFASTMEIGSPFVDLVGSKGPVYLLCTIGISCLEDM